MFSNQKHVIVLTFFLALLIAVYPAAGQQAPAPAEEVLSAVEVQIQRDTIAAAQEMDEALRARILEIYDEALAHLQRASDFRGQAKHFDQLREEAPEVAKRMQEALEQPLPEDELDIPESLLLSEVEQKLAAAEIEYKGLHAEFEQLMKEPDYRAERRRDIPGLVATARDRLQEARNQLAAPLPAGDPQELQNARRTLERARVQVLADEINSFEKELLCYEARNTVLNLRQEELKRRLSQAEKRYRALQEETAHRRRDDAQRADNEARQALAELAEADPAIRDWAMAFAEETVTQAAKRTGPEGITRKIELVTQLHEAEKTKLSELSEEYDRIIRRVQASGLSSAVGVLLRDRRAKLPNQRTLLQDIDEHRDEYDEIALAKNDLLEMRLSLADEEREVRQIIDISRQDYTEAEKEHIRTTVLGLFQSRRTVLEALERDYSAYQTLLINFNTTQKQLYEQTRKFDAYIRENILWISSSSRLGLGIVPDSLAAIRWLTDLTAWQAVPGLILDSFLIKIGRYAPVLLILLLWLLFRRRARFLIVALSKEAAKKYNVRFVSSLETFFLTLFVGCSWPAMIAYLGWLLSSGADVVDQARAVGMALLSVSLLLLCMENMRQVLRPGGLAEAHFGWPESRVQGARRTLFLLGTIILPLIFLAMTFENQTEEAWKDAVGRLAFVGAMIVVSVLFHRLSRQMYYGLLETRRATVFIENKPLRVSMRIALAGLPVFLALLALSGYYFTAVHLAFRLYWTLMLALCVLLVSGMVRRWLLLTRRRLAIKHARQRRELAKAEAEQAQTEGATLPSEADLIDAELSLVRIDTQTQSLVRSLSTLTIIFGTWFIWADVVPALNILSNINLWPTTVDVQETITNAAGELETVVLQKPGWITASNLFFSMVILLFMYLAVRNLPGLIEIILLQRLKMGAGERYATLAIMRYIFVGIGIVAAFKAIGVGWSSVQWLVAALGVGLGFGLQEIFANFISGLILFFERPIRVGDIITIGNISGRVSQIRIRATIITDWDRKELVVPNKEFVTGQLVNWTLSDNVLRIVIPVGIAYGSDTWKAQTILKRVIRAHPDVLEDPEPQVFFLGFGDSALNFETRVFCDSTDLLLPIRHDLHMQIDQAFREAGIEIAFPQHDIHIRSGLESLIRRAQEPNPEAPQT